MADIILGNDIATNKPITMDNKNRCEGMLVLGRTGSGKTTFIEELIAQDMQLQFLVGFLDVGHRFFCIGAAA